MSACTEVEEGKCSESRDILLEEMKKLPENIAERWNKFITGSLDQVGEQTEHCLESTPATWAIVKCKQSTGMYSVES